MLKNKNKNKNTTKKAKKKQKKMQKHKLSLIEESSRFYQLIVESFNKKTVIMRTKEVIFSFLGVTLQKSQWYNSYRLVRENQLFLAEK